MLNLMAQQGGCWQRSVPLPLSCLSAADYPSPLLHYFQFPVLRPQSHRLLLQRPADRLHQLMLPGLPVLRGGGEPPSRAPRPLRSFCIKDILGRDADSAGDVRLSAFKRGDSSQGSFSPGSVDAVGNCSQALSRAAWSARCPQSNKVCALSASPSTPASTSGCPSPSDQPCLSPVCGKGGPRIVRPWAPDPCSPHARVCPDSAVEEEEEEDDEEEEEEEISVDDDDDDNDDDDEEEEGQCPRPVRRLEGSGSGGVSPLDALMALTSKTLTGMHSVHRAESRRREHEALLFSRHAGPKKRRKSRTAFSNQQIYQLEQRFLYQKYLTPTDRDHIAHTLGLSSAQVITWFQNRRAKLKRDLEELKNDVTAATKHSVPKASTDKQTHKTPHHHHRHSHKPPRGVGREDGRRSTAGRDASCPLSSKSSSPSSSFAREHVPSGSSVPLSILSHGSSGTSLTAPVSYRGSNNNSNSSSKCSSRSSSSSKCSSSSSSRNSVGLGTLCNTENHNLKDSPVSVSDDDLDCSSSSDMVVVTDAEAKSRSIQQCCMTESGADCTGRIYVGSDFSPPNSSEDCSECV